MKTYISWHKLAVAAFLSASISACTTTVKSPPVVVTPTTPVVATTTTPVVTTSTPAVVVSDS